MEQYPGFIGVKGIFKTRLPLIGYAEHFSDHNLSGMPIYLRWALFICLIQPLAITLCS